MNRCFLLLLVVAAVACTPRQDKDDDDDDNQPTPSPTATSDPDGPQVLSFNATATQITEGDSVTFTAIVSDPDGIEDLAGGQLISGSGAVYGPFTSLGDGTYSVALSWADMHSVVAIEMTGASQPRTFTAEFFDASGHRGTALLDIDLTCHRGLGTEGGSCVDIDSGTYTVQAVSLPNNGCGLNTEGYVGATFTVTVSDDQVQALGVTLTETTPGVFTYSGNGPIDYTDNGFDCVLDATEAIDVTITGLNQLDLHDSFTFELSSGSECIGALNDNGYEATALPCSTDYTLESAL